MGNVVFLCLVLCSSHANVVRVFPCSQIHCQFLLLPKRVDVSRAVACDAILGRYLGVAHRRFSPSACTVLFSRICCLISGAEINGCFSFRQVGFLFLRWFFSIYFSRCVLHVIQYGYCRCKMSLGVVRCRSMVLMVFRVDCVGGALFSESVYLVLSYFLACIQWLIVNDVKLYSLLHIYVRPCGLESGCYLVWLIQVCCSVSIVCFSLRRRVFLTFQVCVVKPCEIGSAFSWFTYCVCCGFISLFLLWVRCAFGSWLGFSVSKCDLRFAITHFFIVHLPDLIIADYRCFRHLQIEILFVLKINFVFSVLSKFGC